MNSELKNISDFLVVSSTITKVDKEHYVMDPSDELILVLGKNGCEITLSFPENGKKLIIKDGSGFSTHKQIHISYEQRQHFYINSYYGSLRLLGDGEKWICHDNHYGLGKLFMKQSSVCSNGILYNEFPYKSGFFCNNLSIENRNGTLLRNNGPDQKWNVVLNINHTGNFYIHVADKTITNKKDVVVDMKHGDTLWVSVEGIIEKSGVTIIQLE